MVWKGPGGRASWTLAKHFCRCEFKNSVFTNANILSLRFKLTIELFVVPNTEF